MAAGGGRGLAGLAALDQANLAKDQTLSKEYTQEAARNKYLVKRDFASQQDCDQTVSMIMMTTIAAFAGTLPIAIGFGAGGAARRALGLAVCGGLVIGQLATLLITAVIYTYFDELQNWLGRRAAGRGSAGGSA
ncbi:hypothetical protein AAU61_16540 [Desulfocarbo indianensis]|nr:hypothetical protein AAU61_16540 [Desulfocarbo indianensis]